jgi:cell division protein FtsN
MRDARKIKERNEQRVSPKLGVAAVIGLATALFSYNVGLQIGLSRGETAAPVATEPTPPLSAIDTAQKKHDAMQFYTRLTQQDKPTLATPPGVQRVEEVAPATVAEAMPKAATEESARDAIARIAVPPAEKRSAAVQAGEFTVQVSAFQTPEEAEAYKASLSRKGYNPYVIPAEITGKGVWYRVRVGRYETKNKATEAKAQLALVNIPSFVVESN